MNQIAVGLMALALSIPGAAGARAQGTTPNAMVERVDDRHFGGHEGFRSHDHDDFRFHDHDDFRFRNRFFFGGNIYVPDDSYGYGYGYYPPQLWYWCGAPAGYYPYVQQCAVPWRAVPAQ